MCGWQLKNHAITVLDSSAIIHISSFEAVTQILMKRFRPPLMSAHPSLAETMSHVSSLDLEQVDFRCGRGGRQADRRTGKQEYRQADRHTSKQKERQTCRQVDRQTGIHSGRQTGGQGNKLTGRQIGRRTGGQVVNGW